MNIFSILLTVAGLILFEVISSIDNAIINAEVLSTMTQRARRWFLLWGLLFAVFMVRGLLPWIIVWVTMPSLGPIGAFTATFSSDTKVHKAMEESAPILLMGGGTFLIFLFFHWLFRDVKYKGFFIEPFFEKTKSWFYAFSSALLLVIVWLALKINYLLAFSAIIGYAVFFLTQAFKHNAEEKEKNLKKSNISDISKIMYLEIIDMTFSIDGVLGAFAFTLSIPLILLGNGIGAFVVREITIGNISRIKKYKYLKNGAMYSILGLGLIMVIEGYGIHVPAWVTPIITFFIIGYFFFKSWKEIKKLKV
ncbi:MAG: DUF475 domain-containing protein [Bacteroidia bacterium]|nr:DUF475 domain-containing protein [Bacteroidia bacterium]